jgi:hypothetical protein
LPVLISPQKSGQVLGISEQKSPLDNQQNQSKSNTLEQILPKWNSDVASEPQAKKSPAEKISSGVMETKLTEKKKTSEVTEGLVSWDEKLQNIAISDKFTLGSSVKIIYQTNQVDLVIGDSKSLEPDTILVLDKASFIKLGGNPETQKSLKVSVKADF